MALEEITHFMYEKREELREQFERAVYNRAKELSLNDVTKEIRINSWKNIESPMKYKGFEYGQTLKFLLPGAHYTAIVDEDKLILKGEYDITVAKFTGEEVKKYYGLLSAAILKAIEEELNNMPF